MSDLPDAVRAELVDRIASQERTIAMWSEGAASRPATMERTARTDIGNSWFDIGVCRVLLADHAAAATAFTAAAESQHSAVRHAEPPPLAIYSAALESAVLSGDHALAAKLASSPVEPESRPSLVRDRQAWALALPALITGDDARAKQHADAADAVPAQKAWYPGLGSAITALVAGDQAGLTDAMDTMLAKHVAYARARKSWCYNWGPCLICVPATVLARLAARRGIAFRAPEVPGARATVPFTLMFTAPNQTMDLQVQFVPVTLTTP